MIAKYLKYKNWYKENTIKLKMVYGGDYKLVAGLIASTSPQYHIKRNLRVTMKLYNAYKNDREKLYQELLLDKAESLRKYALLNCHYNNIIKVLKHNFKKDITLNGYKVNAFFHNLIGDYNFVTIDTWMLRYFNHTKAWMNKGDYIRYSNVITDIAKIEGLYPAQVQAIIWTKIRADYGFKPKNFVDFI